MKMNDPIEVLLHKELSGLRLDQAVKEQLLATTLLGSPPSTKTVKRWIESGVIVYASGERGATDLDLAFRGLLSPPVLSPESDRVG